MRFILAFLLLISCAANAQDRRYRIRAVKNLYYIPDTIRHGQEVRVYSPYLDTILFKVNNDLGVPVAVLTRTYQSLQASNFRPGRYTWEIIFKKHNEYAKEVGWLYILGKD